MGDLLLRSENRACAEVRGLLGGVHRLQVGSFSAAISCRKTSFWLSYCILSHIVACRLAGRQVSGFFMFLFALSSSSLTLLTISVGLALHTGLSVTTLHGSCRRPGPSKGESQRHIKQVEVCLKNNSYWLQLVYLLFLALMVLQSMLIVFVNLFLINCFNWMPHWTPLV